MIPKEIKIRHGTRTKLETYYLYEVYNEKKDAIKEAKYHKKKNKSKYVITKTEPKGITSWIMAQNNYALYLNKVIKLF